MLESLFEEAVLDYKTTNLDSKSYESQMLFGVQIIKDRKTKKIKIYPAHMDLYDEISEDQYKLFEDGWKIGVYRYKKKAYKRQLNTLEEKKKLGRNSNQTQKSLEIYQDRKNYIIRKFNTIRQLINNHKP